MNTLTRYLEAGARADPGRSLFTFLDRAGTPVGSYTYRGFHERTNGLACALAEKAGIGRGEPVLLVYPPGLEMIAAFMACVKVGAVPVPVPPPGPSPTAGDRLRLVGTSAGATRALTDASLLPTLVGRPRLDGIQWVATNDLAEPLAEFADRSQQLLFLQYTSGSTEAPRGVMVSHANVIANCLAAVDHVPVAVCWLPHFHDMGLIGSYLLALIRGGSAIHFSPADFLRRPLLWLHAVGRYRATITGAPNFAFEYCLRRDKVSDDAIGGLDLSTLRVMTNASEHVRPDTMERFRTRFAAAGLAPEALVAAYGLAENTLCVSSGGRQHVRVSQGLLERSQLRIVRGRASGHNTVALASCGTPIDGVDIRIAAPGGTQAAGGEIGEIWIAGPSKALGYWQQPRPTSEVFEARLAGDPLATAYLRTGDNGFLHEGELYVCGRVKDMITVRGVNLYPTDVEAIVERALAPAPTRVAAFAPDEASGHDGGLVILIERPPGASPDLRALHREIRTHIHAPILTLACVARRALATTSSGKLSRHQCRDRWRNGTMRVLDRFDAPARSEQASDIGGRVGELVDLAGGRLDLMLGDLGLDSLELVTLSLDIERFLAARVGGVSEEMFDLRTLQSITVGGLARMAGLVAAGGADGRAVAALYRQTADSVAEGDARAMREDAALPRHIRPRGGSPGSRGRETGAVLLTGATGFLGAHVLEALVRLSGRPILALARAHDPGHARRRVARALSRAAGAAPAGFEPGPRVEALAGDIAAPRLGLPERQWQALSERVTAVIHCAAEVDYVKTYAEVRGANVSGTRELIELCCAGTPKVLHHVSSTFVLGWSTASRVFEDEGNAEMRGLDFGYAQSKWVAEQLVREASARGLDARTYRASFVTASRHREYVREDILARVLSYMIRHQRSVDASNQLSILPVDVCAQNIVALALLDDPGARVFHFTADTDYTMQAVCRCITERYGYEFEYVDIPGIIEHMTRFCGPGDVLYPLVAFFRRNVRRIDSMRDKRYDNRNYRAARSRTQHVAPEPDLADTAGWIVEFLRRERLIPPGA